MLKEKSRLLLIFLLIFVIIGTLIGIRAHKTHSINTSGFHGTLLDHPREIKAFTLTGIDNKPFTKDSLQGKWTILFFGFTHCGSLCPTTMAELGKMFRLLEEQKVSPLPNITMITIDPKRDSLEKLNQYVKAFNPHFFGAHETTDGMEALTQELGIAYTTVTRHASNDSTYDDIEHTGALMLFNPKGELIAFFTSPHHAASLAEDYQLLIHSYNSGT
jgi:protein SCO1/2